MNVFKKIAMFATGFFSVPAIINFAAEIKYSKASAPPQRLKYRWRYGGISYIATGSGKPVLLLHNLKPGSGITDLKETIDRLKKTRRVYAFDFLGYGYSDKPKLSYSSYLFVSLINDFLKDVCGSSEIIAYGHTGRLAVCASEFRPDLITKITALSKSPSKVVAYPTKSAVYLSRILSLPVFGKFIYNIIISAGVQKYINPTSSRTIKRRLNAAHYNKSAGACIMPAFYSGLLEAYFKLPPDTAKKQNC